MQIFVKVNGVQQVVETHPNAVANDIATCLAGQGHACPSFEGLVRHSPGGRGVLEPFRQESACQLQPSLRRLLMRHS